MSLEMLREVIVKSDITLKNIEKIFCKTTPFTNIDEVILGMFKGIIGKADSLLVLIEEEKYAGNDIIARSIFESSVYLNFILQEDTNKRAEVYTMSNVVKLSEMIDKSRKNNDLGKKIQSYLKVDAQYFDNWYKKREAKYGTKYNKNFKKMINHNYVDKWYNVEPNITSFKKVCAHVGGDYEAKYEILYSLLSMEAHGKDAQSYLKNLENNKYTIDEMKYNSANINIVIECIAEAIQVISDYYKQKLKQEFFNLIN